MANSCLPPMEHNESYPDLYTCLDAGYRESIVQLEKIGPKDVNEKKIFIKFSVHQRKKHHPYKPRSFRARTRTGPKARSLPIPWHGSKLT